MKSAVEIACVEGYVAASLSSRVTRPAAAYRPFCGAGVGVHMRFKARDDTTWRSEVWRQRHSSMA